MKKEKKKIEELGEKRKKEVDETSQDPYSQPPINPNKTQVETRERAKMKTNQKRKKEVDETSQDPYNQPPIDPNKTQVETRERAKMKTNHTQINALL